jgi:hypothetical protein
VASVDPEHGRVVAGRRVGHPGADHSARVQVVLVPMMVSWVSSGMLFFYNLFFSLRPDSQASPEYPLARVLATQAGIVLGLLMALGIVLVVHDRRRAIRGDATDAGPPRHRARPPHPHTPAPPPRSRQPRQLRRRKGTTRARAEVGEERPAAGSPEGTRWARHGPGSGAQLRGPAGPSRPRPHGRS